MTGMPAWGCEEADALQGHGDSCGQRSQPLRAEAGRFVILLLVPADQGRPHSPMGGRGPSSIP